MKNTAAAHEAITPAEYRAFQDACDFFNAELFAGSLPHVLVTLRLLELRDRTGDIRYCGRWREPLAMTIEITSPEVEALIRQRMEAGSFKSPEDLIREVLKSSESDLRTGAALVEAMQACPYPEVEIAPPRVPSPVVRDVIF